MKDKNVLCGSRRLNEHSTAKTLWDGGASASFSPLLACTGLWPSKREAWQRQGVDEDYSSDVIESCCDCTNAHCGLRDEEATACGCDDGTMRVSWEAWRRVTEANNRMHLLILEKDYSDRLFYSIDLTVFLRILPFAWSISSYLIPRAGVGYLSIGLHGLEDVRSMYISVHS